MSTSSLVFTLLCFLPLVVISSNFPCCDAVFHLTRFSWPCFTCVFTVFSWHFRCSIYRHRRSQWTTVSCERLNCNKASESENYALNKCPNHFFCQVSLINRCWAVFVVRCSKEECHQDPCQFHQDKEQLCDHHWLH